MEHDARPKEGMARKRTKNGIGFPQITEMEAWARVLYAAFDAMPYHVGSSLLGKEWRDVDVRIILNDDQWGHLFGETHTLHPRRMIAPWAALCTAISIWGQQWTGLPIDFQFQTIAEANDDPTNDGPRSALGLGFYGYDVELPTAAEHDARRTQ